MLASFAVALCAVVEPAVHVTSAPHAARLIPATYMTPEQLENAPVESLTLPQLQSEASRLSDPPTIAGPVAMIAAGGGAALIFGTLTYLAISSLDRPQDPISAVFLALGGIITGIVSIAGAAVATVGGILLPGKMVQRDAYADRLTKVHARMDAVAAGQVLPPPPDPAETAQAQGGYAPDGSVRMRPEVARLENEKPGLGFPIAFMGSGAGAALLGVSYYTSNSRSGSCAGCINPLYIAIALITAGVALAGIGTWQLISRLQQRGEIDEKIRAIEDQYPPENAPPGYAPPPPPGSQPPDMVPPPPPPPPPGASLPPLPLQFSFAFRF
jgi:hypothetical protein